MNNKYFNTKALVQISLTASLYFVLTLVFSAISFGPIQIRVSEMLNFLVLISARYIIGVTIGVAISNFFSPLGIIDVFVGSLSTLIILVMIYYCVKIVSNLKLKIIIAIIINVLMMFTIALEISIIYELNFWISYLSIALGQLLTMCIGGIIFYYLYNSKALQYLK